MFAERADYTARVRPPPRKSRPAKRLLDSPAKRGRIERGIPVKLGLDPLEIGARARRADQPAAKHLGDVRTVLRVAALDLMSTSMVLARPPLGTAVAPPVKYTCAGASASTADYHIKIDYRTRRWDYSRRPKVKTTLPAAIVTYCCPLAR